VAEISQLLPEISLDWPRFLNFCPRFLSSGRDFSIAARASSRLAGIPLGWPGFLSAGGGFSIAGSDSSPVAQISQLPAELF
jgi:hypothetical protein